MSRRDGRKDSKARELIAVGGVFIIAAFVALLLWPQAPLSKVQHYPQGRQTERAAKAAHCDPQAISALRGSEKLAEQANCERDARDRAAQEQSLADGSMSREAAQESAWQAYYQGRSTAFQSALAILVFGATAWAAVAARDAAIYAEQAAKAARDALTQDEKNAVHELRAYVSASPQFIVAFSAQSFAGVKYLIKNHGDTPAHKTRHRAQ